MHKAGESERIVRESQDINRACVLKVNGILYQITVKLLVFMHIYVYI